MLFSLPSPRRDEIHHSRGRASLGSSMILLTDLMIKRRQDPILAKPTETTGIVPPHGE